MLNKADIQVPPIIFGTSSLGNLYQELPWETKHEIVQEMFAHVKSPMLDTAGKYGAGLALEVIGTLLSELGIERDDVLLSNKLGWRRIPLNGDEPTFERGVWKNLQYDAEQDISYEGILRAWEQGIELLGGTYAPDLVSVHDPDEYLTQATSESGRKKLLDNILDAYSALQELKEAGETTAIGVGAKDWRVIRELDALVDLDWVMFANSFTVYEHPPALLKFMEELDKKGVLVINSAVFHSGFLVGSNYFDYREINPNQEESEAKFEWRKKFFAICKEFEVLPATACIQFGISPPFVSSVSLNTSRPGRVKENVRAIDTQLPNEFWERLKSEDLVANDYPYL